MERVASICGARLRVRTLRHLHPPSPAIHFHSTLGFGFRHGYGHPSLSSSQQQERKLCIRSSAPPPPPLCSIFPLREGAAAAEPDSGDVGESLHVNHGSPTRDKLLQVVLVSPQIPGNTGCIARTCAASAVGLHLVGPLGFQVDDTKLKRAGLDYWPYVVVKVHSSWAEFREYFRKQDGNNRLLALTKRGTEVHSEFSYRKGDWLVFGSETSGLPSEVLQDCRSETYGGGTIRIPMVETYVRCLNLSVSVGIALYEACRQLNYEQLQSSSGACNDNRQSFITEDIFA